MTKEEAILEAILIGGMYDVGMHRVVLSRLWEEAQEAQREKCAEALERVWNSGERLRGGRLLIEAVLNAKDIK